MPGRPPRRAWEGLAAGLGALNAGIDAVAVGVVIAAVGVMFAVVVAQVFCRYVLNASLVWAEEAARYLLVLTTFGGASVAMRRGAHMTVRVVADRLPEGARRAVDGFGQVACCLVYAVLVWHGVALASVNFDQMSAALGLPIGGVYLLIPLAGLLLALQASERIAHLLTPGGALAPAPPDARGVA
jgi:TRAP-type C4-dicarboxylate transport system permease small subunit